MWGESNWGKLYKGILVAFLLSITIMQYAVAEHPQDDSARDEHTAPRLPVFTEPGPVYESTLYHDGSVVQIQTEIIWKPMCGSDLTGVTLEQFRSWVLAARDAFMSDPNKVEISGRPSKGANVIFDCDGSVPADALVALDSVAAYFESVFYDEVNVRIDVSFANLGGGVLGSTGSYYTGDPSWNQTRNGLINGMDPDDVIQNWLPPGSTIPVRYDDDSPTVTDENRVYFTVANYKAVIGSIPGKAANMTFNNTVSWDYDPSNGVSGYCFQSVAVHEVGHALGFVSRAEQYYEPNSDIYLLDIIRFRRWDGGENYNPDDLFDFQSVPRLVDYNNPGDGHISDIISVEYRMADGSPYQASHFMQGAVNGIMQPAQGPGETWYPDFLRTADIDVFDAIGWDHSTEFPPIEPHSPSPLDEAVNVDMNNTTLIWSGGDPNPGDTVFYDVYLEADNPPDQLVSQGQTDTVYDPGTLDHLTPYYWRIVAYDNHSDTTEGPVWEFTTIGGDTLWVNGSVGPPGEITTVQVWLRYEGGGAGDSMSSFDIPLTWDASVCTVETLVIGPDFTDWTDYSQIDNQGTQGPPAVPKLTLSVFTLGPPIGEPFVDRGSYLAASIDFRILDTAPLDDSTLVDTLVEAFTPPVYLGFADKNGYNVYTPTVFDDWIVVSEFACGDCNGDGRISIADATYLVAYIYRAGPAPIGPGDVNLDGRITVADATYLVAYIYRGGPAPCEPPLSSKNERDEQ